MVMAPQLYSAKIMHKRLFPKENVFSYSVYYLALPLPAAPIPGWLARFEPKDLGERDGSDPTSWARNILSGYGANEWVKNIVLITMPCVLGYVFNPVSFYLCLDDQNTMRAVLCEVHNTFGEQHTYLCAHSDFAPMAANQWFDADKLFHVSPFLQRKGFYRFRFNLKQNGLGIWIDYFDESHQKQLITSLIGKFSPLNSSNLRRAFWRHPLVTLKAIILIHWQAVRIVLKGIRYIKKPRQNRPKKSASRNLNKM